MENWVEAHWRLLVTGFVVLVFCILTGIYMMHGSTWLDICLACSTLALCCFIAGHFSHPRGKRLFTNAFQSVLMLWWLGFLLLVLNIFVWGVPGAIGIGMVMLWLLLFLGVWFAVIRVVGRVLSGGTD